MCEALTIAAAGSAFAGGALRGYAEQQSLLAQAGIDETNANLADTAAGDASLRGQQKAELTQLSGGTLEGRQTAAYAASGVDVQSGSAVQTVADTAMKTAFQVAVAKNDAAREAWGYTTQATQLRKSAASKRRASQYALIGGLLGGVSGAASYGAPLLRVRPDPTPSGGLNQYGGSQPDEYLGKSPLGGASYT